MVERKLVGSIFLPKVRVGDINMYYEIHGEGFSLVMIAGTPCYLLFG